MDWGISQEGCFDRTIIVQGAVPASGTGNTALPWGMHPTFSLLPQGGHSHVRARGRNLWCKDSSPLDPHQKHGGRHPSPIPPRGTKGRDCGPSPLETPPGARRGSGSGKRSRGRPICSPGVRCAYRCGDAMPDGTGLAQPVGDFRIWSEVRDSQPPFWVI